MRWQKYSLFQDGYHGLPIYCLQLRKEQHSRDWHIAFQDRQCANYSFTSFAPNPKQLIFVLVLKNKHCSTCQADFPLGQTFYPNLHKQPSKQSSCQDRSLNEGESDFNEVLSYKQWQWITSPQGGNWAVIYRGSQHKGLWDTWFENPLLHHETTFRRLPSFLAFLAARLRRRSRQCYGQGLIEIWHVKS